MKSKPSIFFMLLSTVLAILLFKECKKNDYEIPKHILIEKKEAVNMQALYLKYQYQFINKGLKSEYPNAESDYTEFTISLDSLENYIEHAKHIAIKEEKEHLGFRISLGAKKHEETKIPYTNLYYYVVGANSVDKLERPIRFDTLRRIESVSYGDKVLCGSNPPKLIANKP